MMKAPVIPLFLTVLLISHAATAQLKGFSFGPYVEKAWPHGSLRQTNGNGIGAGIAADVKVASRLSAMGSVGFLHFNRGHFPESSSAPINATTIRAGLKYKLPLVYLKVESGSAQLSNNRGSAMILSPGIGFRLLGLDIQGSYEGWLKDRGMSFTSLKVGYHF